MYILQHLNNLRHNNYPLHDLLVDLWYFDELLNSREDWHIGPFEPVNYFDLFGHDIVGLADLDELLDLDDLVFEDFDLPELRDL